MWLVAAVLYVVAQVAPVADVWQASSGAKLWQGLEQIALRTYLAVLLCLGWSLAFEGRRIPAWQDEMVRANLSPRWIVPALVGLFGAFLLSFASLSLATAVLGWLLLWISVGTVVVWSTLFGKPAGGEDH